MTAAVGLPTLRLIRWAVGPWTLAGLAPGAHVARSGADPRGMIRPRAERRTAPRRCRTALAIAPLAPRADLASAGFAPSSGRPPPLPPR